MFNIQSFVFSILALCASDSFIIKRQSLVIYKWQLLVDFSFACGIELLAKQSFQPVLLLHHVHVFGEKILILANQ